MIVGMVGIAGIVGIVIRIITEGIIVYPCISQKNGLLQGTVKPPFKKLLH
jgi:hypothetical protein